MFKSKEDFNTHIERRIDEIIEQIDEEAKFANHQEFYDLVNSCMNDMFRQEAIVRPSVKFTKISRNDAEIRDLKNENAFCCVDINLPKYDIRASIAIAFNVRESWTPPPSMRSPWVLATDIDKSNQFIASFGSSAANNLTSNCGVVSLGAYA